VCLKSCRKEKKFHDWTWAVLNLQPSDLCSNAYRSLPGGQVYSPCYFHVSISIGTPESDSLSSSTPRRTKWTLVYLLYCTFSISEKQSTNAISLSSLYAFPDLWQDNPSRKQLYVASCPLKYIRLSSNDFRIS